MFNLIKMDLYRLVNAKSFKVMLCVVTLLALIPSLFYTSTSSGTEVIYEDNDLKDDENVENPGNAGDLFNGLENGYENETEKDDGVHLEITLGQTDDELKETNSFLHFLNGELKSAFIFLLLAIFVTLYVNAEHKNGYEKNIIGNYPERIKPVCSKLIVSSVYTIIIMTIYSITCLCTCYFAQGENFYFGKLGQFLPLLGTLILMHIAFSWFISFLCILSKSNSFAMTIGILMSSGVAPMVYMGIDKIVDKLFENNKFSLTYNTLEVAMSNLGNIGETIQTKMIIIPLVYMVFSTAASIIIMRKRDVR